MDDPVLLTVVTNLARTLARRLGSGELDGRSLQDGLDARTSGDIDHFIDGRPGILDQPNHRQKKLSVANEKIRQSAGVPRGNRLVL